MNNNIDDLIFQHHDTYVYYSGPLLNSEHRINLEPINNDPDNVYYSSYITDLYVNEKKDGTYKVNRFTRNLTDEPLSSLLFIGTITTSKGTLIFNYGATILTNNNLYVLNQNLTTYATYKSDFYSKFLNVKININIQNNDYRVVTISY